MDEIHLLHDDRGPVIESIIARTVRQIEARARFLRSVPQSVYISWFSLPGNWACSRDGSVILPEPVMVVPRICSAVTTMQL